MKCRGGRRSSHDTRYKIIRYRICNKKIKQERIFVTIVNKVNAIKAEC